MSWDLNPGSSQSSLSSVIICNQKLILKTSQDIFIYKLYFLYQYQYTYVYQDSFDSDDSIMNQIEVNYFLGSLCQSWTKEDEWKTFVLKFKFNSNQFSSLQLEPLLFSTKRIFP